MPDLTNSIVDHTHKQIAVCAFCSAKSNEVTDGRLFIMIPTAFIVTEGMPFVAICENCVWECVDQISHEQLKRLEGK